MRFEGIALKLSVTCPSLATEDWKHFQCLNIALNNKTGPLYFWNSIDARKALAF